MKLKQLLFSGCFILLTGTGLRAQGFTVPQQVVLKEKEDYRKYETDIIASAKWLEATPLGQEMEKRLQVNAFVVQWITGSPNVSVSIGNMVMKLVENNEDLLPLYLAGYARFILEGGDGNDALGAHLAAIRSILRCYALGGDVQKSKALQKAATLEKKGGLREWVQKEMEK
ncbi:MAG TPA: hypothetical protein VHK69_03315 [Chitinophagaceae bacterium]|jgi:hypothetical protein|nr:hypothetical protein [Chitinophagaceae bacterium]